MCMFEEIMPILKIFRLCMFSGVKAFCFLSFISMSGEKKTSKAWQFFTDLKDGTAKCNFCAKIISYRGGGPYSLIRHTKSRHPPVFMAIKEGTSPTPPSQAALDLKMPSTSTAYPDTQASTSAVTAATAYISQSTNIRPVTKITDFIPKHLTAKKIEDINKILVKLFAKNYLPFLLVESPELKEFVKELNPNYQLPSRKTLSNVLLENYFQKTKETVQSQLQQTKYVALNTDGWLSKPNENYLTVTAHFIGEDSQLKSYMLECTQFSDRHIAENLASQ